MSQLKKAVITAISNQQEAVTLSMVNGVAQSYFEAKAVPLGSPAGTAPTHCWANGWFEDTVIALYQADARFQVLQAADRYRSAAVVLAEHSPPLQAWVE